MDNKLINEAVTAATNTVKEEATTLARLEAVVSSDNFRKAVTTVAECDGKLFIIGLGKSGLVGAKISATFSSVGVNSVFLHAGDALHGDMGAIASDDVALLISKSGETREVLEVATYLHDQGNPTIGLTNDPNSSLAKATEVHLPMSADSEGCPMNLAPMASAVATMAIGDALAAALIIIKEMAPEKFARYHPGGKLGWMLTGNVSDLIDRKSNPIGKTDDLLRNVVAKLVEYRMGAVSIVGNDGRLVGVVTDGDLKRIIVNGDEKKLQSAVSETMSANPHAISLNATAAEALDIMEGGVSQISVLPVVDNDNKPVGLLRLHDVIKSHY